MSTTLGIYSTPPDENGLTLPFNSAVVWQEGVWVLVAERISVDIHIIGIDFEFAQTGSADFTTEILFEIGLGHPAAAVTKIQFPISCRTDTLAAFRLTPKMNLILPEQYTVYAGNTICIRATNSQYGVSFANGVKMLYMATQPIASPAVTNALNFENYKAVSAASGISVTEKVR